MQVSGHLRKRGDNTYQLIVELPPDKLTGKRNRKYVTLHNITKKQAEKALRKMEIDIENDEYIDRDGTALIEWIDKWFNLFKKDISPTTERGYRDQIKIYIRNHKIGGICLQDLTTEDVQSWINDISAASPATGEPLSPKTVKNVYTSLNEALNKAVDLNKVKRNPCKGVNLPKCTKYQGEVYDEAEVVQLLKCAADTDMELPIKLALTLGLRRGELLALKWNHIDFDKATITVDENLVYVDKSISTDGYITKAPKSASGIRTLCISDKLIELLKKHHQLYIDKVKEKGEKFNDEGYVICQPNGKPYKPNSMTRKFDRFLDKQHLKKIRLHDLRHTNATLMLKNGISAKEAQARLGHADVSVTLGTYSHVLDSMQRSTAEKIESSILG